MGRQGGHGETGVSPTEARAHCQPPHPTGRPSLASFWSSSGTRDPDFTYSAPYSDPKWYIQECTQGVTASAAASHNFRYSLGGQPIKRKSGNPDSHSSLSPEAHAPGVTTSSSVLTFVRTGQRPADSGDVKDRLPHPQLSDVHLLRFPCRSHPCILYPGDLHSCRTLRCELRVFA